MERLQSHRDFVRVLKRRSKVTDRDIVVHFLVRADISSDAASSDAAGQVHGASIVNQPTHDQLTGDCSMYGLLGHNQTGCGRSARRLGLAVAKNVGNAVTRNAVKRRFRVLAKRNESLLPAYCDIVLRAKPSAAHARFDELDRQISALFEAVSRKSVGRASSSAGCGGVVADSLGRGESRDSAVSLRSSRQVRLSDDVRSSDDGGRISGSGSNAAKIGLSGKRGD